MVVYDPSGQRHLLRADITGKFMVVTGDLPRAQAYTMFNVVVTQTVGSLRINIEGGKVLAHQQPEGEIFRDCVEVCSGIGCMGYGIKAAGFTIRAVNDKQASMCDFQKQQGVSAVHCGDLNDDDVLVALHGLHPNPCLLAGGFSCQPWSALGDHGGFNDDRSSALVAILRAGYFLRSHSLLLECVPGAGKDPTVQGLLREFCELTGYKMTQFDTKLEDLMPIRRHRWWCLVVNPIIPSPVLRPMPKLDTQATFQDLIPVIPDWPEREIQALALDQYETRMFEEYGGLGTNIIYPDTVVKTALHGWGNQLTACPCHCRLQPLSHKRLSSKGMFGALIVLPGEWRSTYGVFPRTRHVHPWELAVLHGLPPVVEWGENMRFCLAGLGQLASPIQAVWVASHFTHAVQQLEGEHPILPEAALGILFNQLFVAITETQPVIGQHVKFVQFASKVWKTLAQSFHDHHVPLPLSDKIDENIQRTGRKDLKTAAILTGENKQPAFGPPEPNQEGLDPTHVAAAAPCTPVAHDHPVGVVSSMETFSGSPFAHDHVRIRESGGSPPPLPVADASAPFKPHPVHGGIPAFASSQSDEVDHSFILYDALGDALGCPLRGLSDVPMGSDDAPIGVDNSPDKSEFNLTQEIAQSIDEIDSAISHVADTPVDAHHLIWVIKYDDHLPMQVRVHKDATIGSCTVAEERLGVMSQPVRVMDTVGTLLPYGEVTTPCQQLVLQYIGDYEREQITGTPPSFAQLPELPRSHALMLQKGWVADDEFAFYLATLEGSGCGYIYPTLVVPSHVIEEELQQLMDSWVDGLCQTVGESQVVATAFLINQHWHPVVVSRTALGLQVRLTPEGAAWVEPVFRSRVPTCEVRCHGLPTKFSNDCGFQAIAWLGLFLSQYDAPADVIIPCIQPSTACGWRNLFASHLRATDQHDVPMRKCNLFFGGGGTIDPVEQIEQLLQQHGVPTTVSAERANVVLEKLGRATVLNILRGNTQWRDLKHAANQITPKLQLVLNTEMQEAIKTRANNKQPVTTKKERKPKTNHKQTLQLQARDVQVPEGIFREGSHVPLKQIDISQVGPEARGIILVDPFEAVLYLRRKQQVSTKGLAMIVIGAQPDLMHGAGQPVRFPAKCLQTDEPIILSAYIVQLGGVEVSRNVSEQAPKVDVVVTNVIKVLAFQDELGTNWKSLQEKPVRFLLDMIPEIQEAPHGREAVLDVWDRQWLNVRMEKVNQDYAGVFSVCLRLTGIDVKAIMQRSGQSGVYYEPKTQDGRGHSDDFRVIWLNRHAKMDAVVQGQSIKQWSCLVRSNQRFGIRVEASQAEQVHNTLKPSTPFLTGTDLLQFVGGPFPYGATRQSLASLFKSWGWNAKPCQPKSRSSDGKGILWNIQSVGKPPYDVYQMDHADILLSQCMKKTKSVAAVGNVIQASDRTMDALKTPANPKSAEVDPLQVSDPWAPPGLAKRPAIVTPNMEELASQVEQKVRAAMMNHPVDPADAPMQDDSRLRELEGRITQLGDLETRMNQLEVSVQQQHQEQAQTNQAMVQQINAMSGKIDSHASTYQTILDTRMEEQLRQIERLINKKARTE